jgi:hypothetical protein
MTPTPPPRPSAPTAQPAPRPITFRRVTPPRQWRLVLPAARATVRE